MGRVPASDLDAAFPTSHVEVGGGGVAHTSVVGGHALIFALVGLLAALNLQSPCGEKGEMQPVRGGPGAGRRAPPEAQLAHLWSRLGPERQGEELS